MAPESLVISHNKLLNCGCVSMQVCDMLESGPLRELAFFLCRRVHKQQLCPAGPVISSSTVRSQRCSANEMPNNPANPSNARIRNQYSPVCSHRTESSTPLCLVAFCQIPYFITNTILQF